MKMNLRELIDTVRDEGYSQANAEARVCQDIVLKAIDKSAFADHITVKGGVVMRSITGDARRATQDMDLDFIRYSLRDDSIRSFVSRLNCLDGVTIQIAGEIEELSQQEYHGKRVFITITDETSYSLRSKIDLPSGNHHRQAFFFNLKVKVPIHGGQLRLAAFELRKIS